jgi:hypothetical protein
VILDDSWRQRVSVGVRRLGGVLVTEAEWLCADEPWPLLGAAELTWSRRKAMLFCVACARRAWHLMTDVRSRRAIVVAEAYIEGLAGVDDLKEAARAAEGAIRGKRDRPGRPRRTAAYAALHAANAVWLGDSSGSAVGVQTISALQAAGANPHVAENRAEAQAQAGLLRDIAGNPFRPIGFDPRWRTSDVASLAWAAYDDGSFDRLPLLADALMDAGCDSEDILPHCRSDGLHARGCWAVHLVLGKE